MNDMLIGFATGCAFMWVVAAWGGATGARSTRPGRFAVFLQRYAFYRRGGKRYANALRMATRAWA